ncbi:hypothetical protein VPH35_138129 [Triticum aestivum]
MSCVGYWNWDLLAVRGAVHIEILQRVHLPHLLEAADEGLVGGGTRGAGGCARGCRGRPPPLRRGAHRRRCTGPACESRSRPHSSARGPPAEAGSRPCSSRSATGRTHLDTDEVPLAAALLSPSHPLSRRRHHRSPRLFAGRRYHRCSSLAAADAAPTPRSKRPRIDAPSLPLVSPAPPPLPIFFQRRRSPLPPCGFMVVRANGLGRKR